MSVLGTNTFINTTTPFWLPYDYANVIVGSTGAQGSTGATGATGATGVGTSVFGLTGAGGDNQTHLALNASPAGGLVISNYTGQGPRNITLTFVRLTGPAFNIPNI